MTGDGSQVPAQRGPWYRRSPAREIVAVLAFKIVALILLYVTFFGPGERVRVDPDTGPPFFNSASRMTEGRGGDV